MYEQKISICLKETYKKGCSVRSFQGSEASCVILTKATLGNSVVKKTHGNSFSVMPVAWLETNVK
jgi:hypothetical protein